MFELLQRIKRDGALSIEGEHSEPASKVKSSAKYPSALKSPTLG
jgi:hypothetical protein